MIIWRLTVKLMLLALFLSACNPVNRSPKGKTKFYKESDPSVFQAPSRPAVNISRPHRHSHASRSDEKGEISSISIQDVFTLQQADKALIIDARPAYFYQLGHIPTAINVPADNCDLKIEKMEADIKEAITAEKTIIVYCSGILCKDATTVSRHLTRFGYPIHKFYGGWNAWQEAELPSEKSNPQQTLP